MAVRIHGRSLEECYDVLGRWSCGRHRSVRCLRSVLDVGHGWLGCVGEVVRENIMTDVPVDLCFGGGGIRDGPLALSCILHGPLWRFEMFVL
jgi:hypothetical protein